MKKEEHKVGYSFFKVVLGGVFKLYYRPKVFNKEVVPSEGPIIICSNHMHLFDQNLACISIKRMLHYMAKDEHLNGKFGWFFKLSGCIGVNRSIHDQEAKDHAIEVLNNNYALGLFPEGTRNQLVGKDEIKKRIFDTYYKDDLSYEEFNEIIKTNMVAVSEINLLEKLLNDKVISKKEFKDYALDSAKSIEKLYDDKKISYDDYVSISRKIEELSKFNCKNEKEKVALISDYIQSHTQYIDGYESVSSKGTFITPDFPEYNDYRSKSGLVETVINDNNGVCMGIANASTLLLNNPQVDVEVESVYGCSHVWNKVLIDGKYYYFDNTWSITRNENMSEEGLIGLSFTRKYLLFGQKTANAIGHHDPQSIFIYDDGVISEEDIDNINYQSKFVYQKGPIYRSKKKY